jgi:hypothetical protein
MTALERPNTLSGLLELRKKLAGEAQHLEGLYRQKVADLAHVDCVIRLYDPDADLGRAKPVRPQSPAAKGEMSRACLRALRDATAPITSLEIAREVCAARGLADDPRMLIVIRKRVGAALWKLREKGIVAEVPQSGEYKGWKLALTR